MRTPSPWLRFDFGPGTTAGSGARGAPRATPLVFTDPVETVVATRLDEVRPALVRVQAAADAGLWAAGYVAYEAAPAFDPAMVVHDPAEGLPLVWFGLFDGPRPSEVATPESAPGPAPTWNPSVDRAAYDAGVAAVRAAIARGDSYQVNYTLRMRSPWSEQDAAAEYDRLRQAQQAGYAACLDLGRHLVLSASPELLFARHGQHVTTRPMKGTVRRGRWPAEDDAAADALLASEKNRAENVMITDLLRNDLGRVAEVGSVLVSDLCALEAYPTVWQLTSTVHARVPPATTLDDLFTALFPCGSVTGAPKIESVRRIAALEADPRGVYCGAVGVVAPGGDATFNVAIRTVVVDRATGVAEYGVGGGITWDSTADDEYAELLAKAAVLHRRVPDFALLETLLLEDGAYRLRTEHLDRLRESARFFRRSNPTPPAGAALDAVAARHPTGRWRVRLLVAADGTAATEAYALEPASGEPVTVLLARGPVESADPFLQHKTTHRAAYAPHRALLDEAGEPRPFDVLLHNERGELTEFTTANVVVELDGQRWTPPRTCGLLPGVERGAALAAGTVRERVLGLDDLARADAVWLVNSVRGWLPVRLPVAAG